VLPEGCGYLPGAAPSCRASGLAGFARLEDGAVLYALGFLPAPALAALGACSRALYVFAHHGDLWRALALKLQGRGSAPGPLAGANRLRADSTATSTAADSATVAAAAGAVWNVSFEPIAQAEVSALPSVLVRCMNIHASDANVIECAIGVLTNMAIVATARTELLRAGVVEAVLNAVRRHGTVTPVLTQACQFLCLLGAKPEGKQRLQELGVIHLASELGTHPCLEIQKWSGLLVRFLK
jgi:hypothetical protein